MLIFIDITTGTPILILSACTHWPKKTGFCSIEREKKGVYALKTLWHVSNRLCRSKSQGLGG